MKDGTEGVLSEGVVLLTFPLFLNFRLENHGSKIDATGEGSATIRSTRSCGPTLDRLSKPPNRLGGRSHARRTGEATARVSRRNEPGGPAQSAPIDPPGRLTEKQGSAPLWSRRPPGGIESPGGRQHLCSYVAMVGF
jgi:hypothetical protein